MKQSEFLRWLIAQGVVKEEGSKHIKLYYNGNQSQCQDNLARKSKTAQ